MAKSTRPKASAKSQSTVETDAVEDMAGATPLADEGQIVEAEVLPAVDAPVLQEDPQAPAPEVTPEPEPVVPPEPMAEASTEPERAASEAPTQPAKTEPQPAKQQGGFIGMVVGGIIAAAAGYGVATYFPLKAPTEGADQIAGLTTALEAQAKQIAALESSKPTPVDLAPLEGRISALEQAPVGPVSVDLAPLEAKLAELEGRIAALESGLAGPVTGAGTDPALAATVEAMRKEIATLKGDGEMAAANIQAMVAEADARVKAAEAEAARVTADAAQAAQRAANEAALGRIQVAFEAGTPFAQALEQISGAAIPEVLTTHAAEGVPSLSALSAAFPAAARDALDASRYATMGDNLSDRVTTFLENATGARSLAPREGNDPDAVLSRAEALVKAGELQKALDELALLPAEGLQAMEAWMALAKTRLEADAAFGELKTAIAG